MCTLVAYLFLSVPLAIFAISVSSLHGWYHFYMVSDDDDLPGWRQFLWIHLRESIAIVALGWWTLWYWLPLTRGELDGRPALLVHGYTQNPTNFVALRSRLYAIGRPCQAVFLGVPYPWREIERYGRALERALEAQDQAVDLVAHSMGGLVVREVLHRRPELRGKVHRVVTLGTPHHGTAAARVAVIRPHHQLKFESAWYENLPSLCELLSPEVVTTVGSIADMIVYPERTTRQDPAEHVRLVDIGHAGLLVHPESLDVVMRVLQAPEPSVPEHGTAA